VLVSDPWFLGFTAASLRWSCQCTRTQMIMATVHECGPTRAVPPHAHALVWGVVNATSLDAVGVAPADVDVLIVGAGPAGMALTAQLQEYGVRVRLIDRLLDRTHESRALVIQPRTLEVLSRFGVTEEMLVRGNQTVAVHIHFGERLVRVPLFDIGIRDTAYPFLLFLSQAETERILTRHIAARGQRVERGVELIDLRQAADTVTCRLRHRDGTNEVVHVRYVVGCDGAHSTVREQAGIAFEGYAYPQTFVLADVEADGLERDVAHAFLSSQGMLFFFPFVAPTTWRVQAMRSRTDTTSVERPVTLREVRALTYAHASSHIRLHDAVWMTNFRVHNRGATQYRSGRVFLAGDAAHIHSPAGGQGMNTGIQDAINLGWKLGMVTAGVADPGVLDSYELERLPVGKAVQRFTDRLFTIATSDNWLIRLARTQLGPNVIPLALRSKNRRVETFRTISQLAIRYRKSPLSLEGPNPPRHGPRAGDRLPDALVTLQGRVTTVYRALSTTGFHLLLVGSTNVWTDRTMEKLSTPYKGLLTVHRLTAERAAHALQDHTGAALRRFGLTESRAAHYLVRPDGYIAYRAGSGLAGVHAYIARWLPGRV
jgi:2-polyprenyl-6-methoxyphenol hydroxylase-like FAD-dependent oxidoreductase